MGSPVIDERTGLPVPFPGLLDEDGQVIPGKFDEWIEQERAEREAQVAAAQYLTTLRDNLSTAREVLLAFGTPTGLSFAETMSATQTALYDYRDSGLTDSVCEEIKTWMTARSVEIIASAAYSAGLFGALE